MGMDADFKIVYGAKFEDIRDKLKEIADKYITFEDGFSLYDWLSENELIHYSGDWNYENEEGIFGVEVFSFYGPSYGRIRMEDLVLIDDAAEESLNHHIHGLMYYDEDEDGKEFELDITELKNELFNFILYQSLDWYGVVSMYW